MKPRSINSQKKNEANSVPFSLSKQPLTAFAILSYGKRDFAEAEGRKTEIGEVGGAKIVHWTRTA